MTYSRKIARPSGAIETASTAKTKRRAIRRPHSALRAGPVGRRGALATQADAT